jgi:mannose-6-phosphate isomerase
MMYRLSNPLQSYEWGSKEAIFEAFGWETTGLPGAELWLGAHPLAVSVARTADVLPAHWQDYRHVAVEHTVADGVSLIDLIKSDPHFMLGEAVEEEFGPRLPYLMKILAADQPLSLQVHPKPHIARRGFMRENAAGVALNDPERNYKDESHKPEMLVAMTPFEGLSGFRRPQRIIQLLEHVKGDTASKMREMLQYRPSAAGIEQAFTLALELRGTNCSVELDESMDSIAELVRLQEEAGETVSRGHRTALELFERYPGDPGALVSLMLNRFSLQPGEAVYLGAGQVHAYLSGLGVEIMASSDNVLRAGLTHKKVDVPELLQCTDFAPTPAGRPRLRAGTSQLTEYRPGVPEFALIYGGVEGSAIVPHNGPRIVLCLSGELEVSGVLGPLGTLAAGQSAFVPHGVGNLGLRGDGSVAIAYVP